MKKIFLSLALIAGLSFTIYASPKKGEGHRGRKLGWMKELDLSQDQQEKLKMINKDFRGKLDSLKEDASLTKEARKEKTKELLASRQAQVKSILTPEQQEKWDKAKDRKESFAGKEGRKDFRKYRKHARQDKHNSFRKGRTSNLELSEEQKSKAESLNKDFKQKMKALNEDTSLSKDAKKEKRKELIAGHRSQFNSILTPDQQSKLENFSPKDNKFRKGKGKRGERMRLSENAQTELKALKENFLKEKKAIELSRIAPEAQKDRIKELKDKYRTDRREIISKERQRKS